MIKMLMKIEVNPLKITNNISLHYLNGLLGVQFAAGLK